MNEKMVIGGPGETKKTVQESLAYADSLNLDSMKVTAGIRIYHQTLLAQQARKEGIIKLKEKRCTLVDTWDMPFMWI
jgi:hypothetical protein